MTCIVGITNGTRCWIGADSLGADDYWNAEVRKNDKCFRVGEFIIGTAGSTRANQLLQFSLQLPPAPDDDTNLFRYMVVDFVEAVRECFRKGGWLSKEKEREAAAGGIFLVGCRARLFTIESDLQVGENVWGYHAIGCGASFALGSLHRSLYLGRDERVDELVIAALIAAEQFSIGVRRPFHVISTLPEAT